MKEKSYNKTHTIKIFDKCRENSFAIDVLTNKAFLHFIITRESIHRFFLRYYYYNIIVK